MLPSCQQRLFAFITACACLGGPATVTAAEQKLSDDHASKIAHAMQLFRENKFHEAEVEFRALLDADEKKHGLDHADTLQDRKNLGIVLGVEGEFVEAEKILQEGIDFETGILGPENKDVLEFREILANTLAREHRNTEAVREFRAILAIRERISDEVAVARTRSNLGGLLIDMEQFWEAEPVLRTAQEVFDKKLQPRDPAALLNRTNLGKALLALGRFPEAEKEQRAVLASLQQIVGATHPEAVLAQLNLAAILHVEKKDTEALELARQAETQLAQIMGPDAPKVREARALRQGIEQGEPPKKKTKESGL